MGQTNRRGLHDSLLWILVVTLGIGLAAVILGAVCLPDAQPEDAYFYTFMSYGCFVTTWAVVLFAVFFFKKNRFMMKAFCPNRLGNTVFHLGMGLLAGFVLNGFCAAMAFLHGDIRLIFQKFELFPVLGLFAAVFIQSSAEEALCRGFMYQRLFKATSRPLVAACMNAGLFAALHLMNDGISPLAVYDMWVTGMFFSLIVFYYDSLWMAMGLHASWNFMQSILLGLPNSGKSFPYSVFRLDQHFIQGSFAYHPEFGLEGTILSALLMTACCVILILVKNRKKNLFGKSTELASN